MIDVLAGIMESSWEAFEQKIRLVSPYVDWVQVGIADGTLIPAITITQFDSREAGSRSARQLAKTASPAGGLAKYPFLEAHLMVADPVKYIRPLVDNGFSRLVAHVEAQDPREFLAQAAFESVDVCLAIDTASDIDSIEPFLEELDGVVVMTAEAGVEGRAFMPETVEKIKLIHENFPDLPIEADGGMDLRAAAIVREAGATRIVSTKYIFDHGIDLATAINRLKNI